MRKSICIFNRQDADSHPGGDTVQIRAISSYLQSCGHEATIVSNWHEPLDTYDLVLIFNLTRPIEAYFQTMQARRYQKPYIIFPVYWDLDSLPLPAGWAGVAKKWLPERAKDWIRLYKFNKHTAAKTNSLFSLKTPSSSLAMIREILAHAVFICPNSEAERVHLVERFQLSEPIQNKMKVVLNGMDTKAVSQATDADVPVALPKLFVSCVGGIGPRKNQLKLVQAAQMAGIPLVLVGKAAPGAEGYYSQVLSEASGIATIIGNVPQRTVFHILRQSSGHIQPSYIETPGLASLEAGALACPIGVSDVGPVREYFGEYAEYCLPGDVRSIAQCLKRLVDRPADRGLSDYIKQRFDWNNVLIPLGGLIRYIEK